MTRIKIDIVLKYMTSEVRIIFGRSKILYLPPWHTQIASTSTVSVFVSPSPQIFGSSAVLVLRHKSRMTGRSEVIISFYFFNESHQWKLGRNVFIINILFCNNNFTFVSTSNRGCVTLYQNVALFQFLSIWVFSMNKFTQVIKLFFRDSQTLWIFQDWYKIIHIFEFSVWKLKDFIALTFMTVTLSILSYKYLQCLRKVWKSEGARRSTGCPRITLILWNWKYRVK